MEKEHYTSCDPFTYFIYFDYQQISWDLYLKIYIYSCWRRIGLREETSATFLDNLLHFLWRQVVSRPKTFQMTKGITQELTIKQNMFLTGMLWCPVRSIIIVFTLLSIAMFKFWFVMNRRAFIEIFSLFISLSPSFWRETYFSIRNCSMLGVSLRRVQGSERMSSWWSNVLSWVCDTIHKFTYFRIEYESLTRCHSQTTHTDRLLTKTKFERKCIKQITQIKR